MIYLDEDTPLALQGTPATGRTWRRDPKPDLDCAFFSPTEEDDLSPAYVPCTPCEGDGHFECRACRHWTGDDPSRGGA